MLTQLLDIFAFLSVILRGLALSCACLIVGGAFFFIWVVKPVKARWRSQADAIVHSSRRLLFWSAVGFAVVQLSYVAADSILLTGTTGLPLAEIAGANFFIAGVTGAAAALLISVFSRRLDGTSGGWLLIPSLVVLVSILATSHAAGRVESRALVLTAGLMHILTAASWIGALAYFVLALRRIPDRNLSEWVCRRFSNLAMLSVIVLLAAGLTLSWVYLDSPAAVYGTAYGVMVSSKIVLFAVVLVFGGLNFLIIRRMATADSTLLLRLQRFAEAEVGIGFTIILAAASLSSQPPATDLRTDRVSLPEIVQRVSPKWPRLDTPPVGALSPATPLGFNNGGSSGLQSFVPGTSYQPNTPNDIAWSEYNHHWAGIIVVIVGLLALAARIPGLSFARHWPLAFLGLAVFLFLRADPENWPLGPRGFWESFAVAEVLQHRVFVLLIILFAIFEWRVANNRISSARAALVFPGVCAAGGALLLTHSHSLGNIREELLAELSHVPLAIFAVIAGWSRWLEIRVPGDSHRIVRWIWPVCFLMIGVLLLDYRES